MTVIFQGTNEIFSSVLHLFLLKTCLETSKLRDLKAWHIFVRNQRGYRIELFTYLKTVVIL